MAKKRKGSKRKFDSTHTKATPITSLCNVSGLQDETDPFAFASATTNELDECLFLMDQSSSSDPIDTKLINNTRKSESEELESSSSSSSSSREKESEVEGVVINNELWKRPKATDRMKQNYTNPPPVDFMLPNIQVELSRHKHMADLSTFLLSKCKHLRMPAFERWLIDSKVEERFKRQIIKENAEIQASQEQHAASASAISVSAGGSRGKDSKWKKRLQRKKIEAMSSLDHHMTSSGLRALNDHDPCIPSMADVEDEASKQLMLEMKHGNGGSGSGSDVIDAMNICKELCQQACAASRHVQNLQQHFGEVNATQYFGKLGGKIVLEAEADRDRTKHDHDDGSTSTSTMTDHSYYSLIYSHSHSRKPKSDGEMKQKRKPFVVKINTEHYLKLREMFHSVHDTAASSKPMNVAPPTTLGRNPKNYSPATNIFHHLIFCISIRYASLSGAQQLLDLRGGGMQGAIHSEVFECISKHGHGQGHGNSHGGHSKHVTECFASPLNAYNSKYFSIFHQDLDWHFGSVGDFFSVPSNFFRTGGVYEANPPFSPGLMQHMVERIESHLKFADAISSSSSTGQRKCPLSFVVIVPSCSSNGNNLIHKVASKSFRSMLRSRFFSKHIVFSAREHGYIEGSQHLRPTRFKESQYDTSAIILQSRDAKDGDGDLNKLVTKEFEEELRKAFASRHQQELEERRNETLATKPEEEEVKDSPPEVQVQPENKLIKKKSKKRRKKK